MCWKIIKELAERQAKHVNAAKAIRDKARTEQRDLSADEVAAHDVELDSAERCSQERERELRAHQLTGTLEARDLIGRDAVATPGEAEQRVEKRKAAFDFYLRNGMQEMPHDMRRMLVTGDTSGEAFDGPETRALSVGGIGVVGPRDFSSTLIKVLADYSGVRQAGATIYSTASGNPFVLPKGSDVSNTGEIVAEAGAITADVDPTLSNITLNAYKYSSKVIKVAWELLQDEAFNLEAELIKMAGERLGRITNTHFTTGTDSSQPNGFVTAATTGVTTAVGTTAGLGRGETSLAMLVDLVHSVDPAYRNSGRCAWQMHDTELAAIRKVVDTTGQPIFFAGNSSTPMSIMGFPVYVNNSMATKATTINQKRIAFGDFSKYAIRDVAAPQVVRLNELYALNGQVGYVVYSRHDGEMLDSTAIKLLVNAAS